MNLDYIKQINSADINNSLAPKPKAEKKKQQTYLSLNRKRKRKTEKSNIAKTISELIKSRVKTADEIQAYFAQNLKIVKNESINFYKTIVETKVLNGNIKISDTLTNKPLYSYIGTTGIKTRTISNDLLFCQLLFHNQRIKNFAQLEVYENSGYIDKITFCSLPFVCNGEVKKGYYQDFSGEFSAIGMQIATEQARNRILGGEGNAVSFFCKGKEYISYGDENSCIVIPSTLVGSTEKIKQLYNEMKTFSTKSKITINEKISNVSSKVRFVSSSLNTESFCPAFLITPEQANYSVLFRIKYDYNKLLEEIKKSYNSKQQLIMPPNIFYWDTMSQLFDFIGVMGITCDFFDEKSRKQLLEIYDRYLTLKDVLELWKQNQMNYQRIIKDFFESFNNVINYDKLMVIRNRIKAYIEMRDMLIGDDSYNDVKQFIKVCNDLNLCGCIVSQFLPTTMNIADEMLRILDNLNNFSVATLVNDLRRLGLAIYNLTYIPNKNNTYISFPFIVSPGNFLGNVTAYQDLDKDPLAIIVEEIKNRKEKKENAKSLDAQQAIYLLKNIDELENKVLMNTISSYLMSKNRGTTNEEMQEILNDLKSKLDENLKNQVKETIATGLIQVGTVDNVSAPTGQGLGNIIEASLLNIDNRKLRLANQNNQLQQNINDLQSKLIQSGVPSSSASSYQQQQQYNIRSTDYYSMDEDESLIQPTSHKAKRDDLINKIRNNQTNTFLMQNPQLPSQWYADVVIFSGLYDVDKNDYKTLAQTGFADLLTKYPIESDVIDVILADYELRDLDQVMENGMYIASKKNAQKINYTDNNYINRRLSEIKSPGFVPKLKQNIFGFSNK